jgi:spore coat protein CotH
MFGVRKLVLNSCTRDSTYLHERLAYHLFRAVGLVASRAVHASVRVNGGPPSLYLLVENIDKEYLEDHFEDPSGNLMKEVWPQHLVPEPYVKALRTNQDVPDVDRMVSLAELLLGVEDDDFDLALAPWIDLEGMARYLVVDQLVHNWDGIWKFYCSGEYCQNHNYFLYDDPTSGQVQVLPWDLDHTFNYPNSDMQRSWWDDGPDACVIQQANAFVGTRAPQCDPLMRGLGVLGWDRYLAALATLTAPGAALSPEAQLALLDGWRAQILPLVEADPLGPSLDQWRRDVAQLRQIIRTQHGEAMTLLAEEGR